MRIRQSAAVLAAGLTAVLGLPAPNAAAEQAATLYVGTPSAGCSDAGSGTQAQPYCSVNTAAAAALPGQTVLVQGIHHESVRITSSGTPDHPIVFRNVWVVNETGPAVVVSGAHDVLLRRGTVAGTDAGIRVEGSTRIGIEGIHARATDPQSGAALRITGASTDVTARANMVESAGAIGISVEGGARGTVLARNELTGKTGPAIAVNGAPQTAVVNNSVWNSCAPGIDLRGESTGSSVVNNLTTAMKDPTTGSCTVASPAAQIAVASEASDGTRVDYNLLAPGVTPYSWKGVAQPTRTDFTNASGQGSHDLVTDPKIWGTAYVPAEGSPAIDSGDATATGVPTLDLMDNPTADDTLVPDTGIGHIDRGAVEVEDNLFGVGLTTDTDQGPYPLTVQATAKANNQWPDSLAYTFDFGDGSPQVTGTSASVSHTYTGPCTCTATVTAASAASHVVSRAVTIKSTEPGPLVPALTVTSLVPDHADTTNELVPLTVQADASATVSPWRVAKWVYDFGDGTVEERYTDTSQHAYALPGDYTVTVTATDTTGRSATVSRPVRVQYTTSGYLPITPFRLIDTRRNDTALPGGVSMSVCSCWRSSEISPPVPGGVSAMVLNITAVDATTDTYLTVWPSRQPRPTTSSLNVRAGKPVANLVTVPIGPSGTVEVFNQRGLVHVVVDVVGYYHPGIGAKFTAAAPARLLDTRKTGTRVTSGATLPVQVSGKAGVPASATAVVLNVTAAKADSGGFLTVWPSGTDRPTTSSLNFEQGQTVANQVIVPIGPDGRIDLYSNGNTHVVADVFGYYSPDGKGLFTPTVPVRLKDTRYDTPKTTLGGGGRLVLPVAGTHGVPAGATAAVLNLTAATATADGWLSVWPDGTPWTGTSNLNTVPNRVVPNHAITPLGANGAIDVLNFAGRTDVVADLAGWFTNG
ncbi:right-handed parallel beta-helix repeat-containing protein [Kitasatospora paranensis]|uniref:PKD domain-containing protein n=1 Tax=Kitasatospora paranensis TaxID=258053 RepID=A0ABW2FNM7_9ACTN